jgi:glutathione S-transferase
MKLYIFPIAPNPTKVRLYLAEKKLAGAAIDVEQVTVDLGEGEQKAPEHLKRNPFGRLPVLEVEEGVHLTESLPMILLLEELHPEPPMIGTTPLERAQTLNTERIAEQGVLLPMACIVHATQSPLGRPPSPEVAQHFREGLPSAFEVLDDQLSDGRAFLMGDTPTVADCTLAAGLQFGRLGKLEIDVEYRHLCRWNAAYRERPSAKEVLVF